MKEGQEKNRREGKELSKGREISCKLRFTIMTLAGGIIFSVVFFFLLKQNYPPSFGNVL